MLSEAEDDAQNHQKLYIDTATRAYIVHGEKIESDLPDFPSKESIYGEGFLGMTSNPRNLTWKRVSPTPRMRRGMSSSEQHYRPTPVAPLVHAAQSDGAAAIKTANRRQNC